MKFYLVTIQDARTQPPAQEREFAIAWNPVLQSARIDEATNNCFRPAIRAGGFDALVLVPRSGTLWHIELEDFQSERYYGLQIHGTTLYFTAAGFPGSSIIVAHRIYESLPIRVLKVLAKFAVPWTWDPANVVASPSTPLPVEPDPILEEELSQLAKRRTPFPGVIDPGTAEQATSERDTEVWCRIVEQAELNAQARSIIHQGVAYVVVMRTELEYGSMTSAVAQNTVPKIEHYLATFINGSRFSE